MNKSPFDRQIRKMEAAVRLAQNAVPGSLEARLRTELEHHLSGLVAARLRAQRAKYEAEQATRLKNQALYVGRRTAVQLRCCILALLGPRSSRLKDFGITPIKTGRRARPTPASP